MYANEKGCFILERILSSEEKIRRAEEIYQRRRSNENKIPINTVNIGNKTKYSLLKKILKKLFFCLILYFILYFLKNSSYIFSEDVINKANKILSFDINFKEVYNVTLKYINDFSDSIRKLENKKDGNFINTQNENNKEIEKKDEMSDEDVNSKKIEENKILQENNLEIDKSNENTSNLQDDGNEIENDVKYILDNFELEKPVNGIITSRFGLRTSSNIISANHTGIDIGASEGEKIKSIAKGTVTLVSSLGDYR